MDEIHVQTNYSLHVTYEIPRGSLDIKCPCHFQFLTSTPSLVQTLLTESADQPRVGYSQFCLGSSINIECKPVVGIILRHQGLGSNSILKLIKIYHRYLI